MKHFISGVVLGLLLVVGAFVAVQLTSQEQPLEGAAGPTRTFPCESTNGVTRCFTQKVLTTATTTVCAIKSPTATSTLVSGGIKLNVSSTTASTVTVAKATTAFATTTLINSVSVSANAQAAIEAASTTESALVQTNRTFAPNTWLVFGMAGGTGTFSPSGSCNGTFELR